MSQKIAETMRMRLPMPRKKAAFSKALRRRYDAMLTERRKQQMLVDLQILPSEDEMSWMVADVSFLKWYNFNECKRRQ